MYFKKAFIWAKEGIANQGTESGNNLIVLWREQRKASS